MREQAEKERETKKHENMDKQEEESKMEKDMDRDKEIIDIMESAHSINNNKYTGYYVYTFYYIK